MGYLNSYFIKSANPTDMLPDVDDVPPAKPSRVGNFYKFLQSQKAAFQHGSRALNGWITANPKKALLGTIAATLLGGAGMGAIAETGRPKPKKDNPYAGGYY